VTKLTDALRLAIEIEFSEVTRGNVVGVVTAKSFSGFGLDSYSMALPIGAVRKFLGEYLPKFGSDRPGSDRMEWDEIHRQVSPSVVMILKRR
jgi:hypothetical protein